MGMVILPYVTFALALIQNVLYRDTCTLCSNVHTTNGMYYYYYPCPKISEIVLGGFTVTGEEAGRMKKQLPFPTCLFAVLLKQRNTLKKHLFFFKCIIHS